ncbi:sulfate/molybdate ABC transporter ATP-binding protein [Halotalea alkalilenta]|uniref:Sulfate ABC transporter ATP-binding protein n=1 Tax=Halotalea alkalilenta TaxID=376489 RepID=A0A172YGR2_9GAMM|nr:TOBE-like domain-containing protein [Halotalea alkalilenta]ANF58458.1 sulfate ABC transporter ATP-binding protein [Halotalea alkalilenta]
MSINIDQVSRRFGTTTALHPTTLSIDNGELVGLLGPSGSGKTTLMRIIAGLEQPSEGRVLFGERDVTRLHVRHRRVGFVFQHYALFRHMSVFENVAFGLRARPRNERPSNDEIKRRVFALLERVQLDKLASRLPAQLSGGQQQRVSLARALAVEPEVLLMDEPFGALDAKVRVELRRWLRHLHAELGFTCVFVTHDQEEALELSDRVVVMSQGRIEQVDEPTLLYRRPINRFVFEFLGETNALSGEVRNGHLALGENAGLDLSGVADGPVELLLRPHEVALATSPSAGARLPVTVSAIAPVGAEVRLELEATWSTQPWQATLSHAEFERARIARGTQCYALPQQLRRVDEASGALVDMPLPNQGDDRP